MKSVPLVCLPLLLLCAAPRPAAARGVERCFRADWLQGARVVRLTIEGDEVAGTFTVEGDDGARSYEFTGTIKGDALTVRFAGGRLPDVAPSEMSSPVWTLVRLGGRELLRIRFRGRNYRSNRYVDRPADFEPCGGAGDRAPAHGGEEAAVADIRRQYAAVNRELAKRRRVRKELSGFSAEGGELVAYFDGVSVVKLAATHLGETGRSVEEFYFRGGELFFVFRRRDTYDRPMSGRVSRTEEERFYFDGGRLIRWLDARGRKVEPGGGEYLEAQARYLDSSKLFVEGARSQKPTIEAPEPNP